MIKRVLIGLLVLFAVIVVFELASLLRLKNSLNAFSSFWRQRAALEGDFVYVALGDSSAQGIGASAPLKGYVGLVAERIETKTGRKVRIVNLSVSGADVNDVTEKQLPQLKNYKADLITVTIGGNDVARNKLHDFERDYAALAGALPDGSFAANIPYFGGRIRRNAEAIRASEIIAGLSSKHGLRLVDLQTPLREQNSVLNYASDLFHPSDRAYRLWADAFWKEIEPSL